MTSFWSDLLESASTCMLSLRIHFWTKLILSTCLHLGLQHLSPVFVAHMFMSSPVHTWIFLKWSFLSTVCSSAFSVLFPLIFWVCAWHPLCGDDKRFCIFWSVFLSLTLCLAYLDVGACVNFLLTGWPPLAGCVHSSVWKWFTLTSLSSWSCRTNCSSSHLLSFILI